MEPIRIMMAAFSAEDRRKTASIITDESLRIVCALRPDKDGLRKAGVQPADVLLIGTTGDPESEFDFAERIYTTRSDLTIVLLVGQVTPEIIAGAMASGIARVVSFADGADGVRDGILAAVTRERNRRSTEIKVASYASKIIVFYCPKGGSGKTTLSISLACALAQAGKKVAIVDMNLQFGDVGVMMDIAKGDTISDLVEENSFELRTIKSYLVRHASGVHVLLASNAPEYAELVKPEHIDVILSTLRSEFDYIIVDTSAVFSDCTIAALELADRIYMVGAPDISTLYSLRRCLAVFEALNVSDKLEIAFNKDGMSSISAQEAESLLELATAFSVPFDNKAAVTAVNRGTPLVLSDPRSKASKAITAFARKMIREE